MTQVKRAKIEKGPSYETLTKALRSSLESNAAKVSFTIDWSVPKGQVGSEVPRTFMVRHHFAQIDGLERITKAANRGGLIEVRGVLLSESGRSEATPFVAHYNYMTRVGTIET